MKKILLLVLVVLPVVIALQGFEEPSQPVNIMADTLCFSRDILPILNSNCAMAKCHDAITHGDGLTLTSYAGVMKGVKAGNPSLSGVYNQINKKTMPQTPYLAVPDSLKSRLFQWITAGAKNDNCVTSLCDTTAVDYFRDIKPIIQVNCVGCHQTYPAAGGVFLNDDDNNELIKVKIYTSSAHMYGSQPMPQNVAQLNSCQMAKLRLWALGVQNPSDVSDGSPNSNDLKVIHTASGNDVVRFNCSKSTQATIALYAADGRMLMQLAQGNYNAGLNEVSFSSNALANGLYIVRLASGTDVRSAKFVR